MSPLLVVVLIVLVDLLGFTIVMPLLPRFGSQYGFSDLQIGVLLAAFPLCQLFAGPILGRLSDRYGRRPVLVISQAGTAVSFVILGLTQDYTIMLLARMLDGALGGNILVAQAYVADVTKPEDRAKGLGLIGAAFGLGFTLGPLLGGLLVSVPVTPEWQLRLPFLVAAGLSTFAWVLVLIWLPESTDAAHRQRVRVVSWRGLGSLLTLPRVGLLVVIGSLSTLAFATLEGTFSLFLDRRLGWSAREAAFGFAYLGFLSAVVQGGLIRRLVPRYGEPRLILVGLASLSVGLAWLATAHSVGVLLAACLVVAIGSGLSGPSISGLLSRLTPPSEQGAIFGTLISAQTLARLINYIVANRLLGQFGPSAPYWEGAAIAAVALGLALWLVVGLLGREPVDSGDREGEVAVAES